LPKKKPRKKPQRSRTPKDLKEAGHPREEAGHPKISFNREEAEKKLDTQKEEAGHPTIAHKNLKLTFLQLNLKPQDF